MSMSDSKQEISSSDLEEQDQEQEQDQDQEQEQDQEETPATNPSLSPLTEADPNSLDEIFTSIDKKLIANIPAEITEAEISKVVDYLWNQREQFNKDQANMIKPQVRSGVRRAPKNIAEVFKNINLDI